MNATYSIYLYFRATLFAIIFMPMMIMLSFIFPKYIYIFGRFISKGIFKAFQISYKVNGEIPNKGPYILMHNHSSFLDLFFLPIIIPTKYTGIIAAKNFKIPIIGTILKQLKGIPIQRSNLTQAKTAINIAEQRLNEGYHIAIFPEGTRTVTGMLSPLKKGGFHMAKNTNTNIIPIAVKGLFHIKPKTRWTLNSGEAEMFIGQPISVTNKSVEQLIHEMELFFQSYNL